MGASPYYSLRKDSEKGRVVSWAVPDLRREDGDRHQRPDRRCGRREEFPQSSMGMAVYWVGTGVLEVLQILDGTLRWAPRFKPLGSEVKIRTRYLAGGRAPTAPPPFPLIPSEIMPGYSPSPRKGRRRTGRRLGRPVGRCLRNECPLL